MSQQAAYSTILCACTPRCYLSHQHQVRGGCYRGAERDLLWNGLLGQRVIVVPSQDLVIARMGLNFLNDFDPVPAPSSSGLPLIACTCVWW